MTIERIELKTFITALVDLYNKGVDYVDLKGDKEPSGEPSLHILFSKDYMSDEAKERMFENEDDSELNIDDLT